MNSTLEHTRPTLHSATLPDLVAAAAEGDQSAWRELVRRHERVIRSVTWKYRLTDEDAADVLQNTWLQLATHLRTLRSPAFLPGWLATTARNNCLKLLSGQREHATALDHLDRPSEEPGPAEHAVRQDVSSIVQSALTRLPARDERLLRLLMQSARPGYREIAADLGIPIGSIGPTRLRALSRMRAELAAASVTDLSA
jgi:RNA polymerase sigma factor (sigma-70 family)